jgi:hypothetical protein
MIGNKDCLSNVAGTSAAVEITHWMTAMVEQESFNRITEQI